MGTYIEKSKPPKGRVFERVHTRKLDRSVAHVQMKKLGLTHVNKHDYSGPAVMRQRINSYFADHWKDEKILTIDF